MRDPLHWGVHTVRAVRLLQSFTEKQYQIYEVKINISTAVAENLCHTCSTVSSVGM